MLARCVLLVVLTLPNLALAVPVTWEIQGVIRTVVLGPNADASTSGTLTSRGVEEGAPFSTSISFDPDVPLLVQSFDGYGLGITDMHLDFPAWSLSQVVGPAGGAGLIVASQSTDPEGVGNPLRSSLVFAGDFFDPTLSFLSPSTGNFTVTLQWGFISDDPHFFSITSLPTDPPDLGALPPWHLDPSDFGATRGAVMYFTNDLNYKVFDVTAEITSATLVPEPGAGALALLAAAVLARKLRT